MPTDCQLADCQPTGSAAVPDTALPGRMQIGELAQRAGVTVRTIHYYERLGLIQPTSRKGTGYRYYDGGALERLVKIDRLKQIGLSLEQVAAVIGLYDQDPSGILGKESILAILRGHLDETDRKISDMQRFREDLLANIARMEAFIRAARSGVETS